MGTLWLIQNWEVGLAIEQYVLATELWVHVSRLLVLHLNRN